MPIKTKKPAAVKAVAAKPEAAQKRAAGPASANYTVVSNVPYGSERRGRSVVLVPTTLKGEIPEGSPNAKFFRGTSDGRLQLPNIDDAHAELFKVGNTVKVTFAPGE